jgi:hypothetical protein
LKPNGIPDDQIQLFEANIGRPGMGRHRLADDIVPLMLQAHLHQSRFKAESFGQTGQNRAEGIEGAGASHPVS